MAEKQEPDIPDTTETQELPAVDGSPSKKIFDGTTAEDVFGPVFRAIGKFLGGSEEPPEDPPPTDRA